MISLDPDRRAVFLDRDGVICENRHDYVKSWQELEFIPGAVEALASLSRSRFRLFVVTNQSCVGRGLVSRRALDAIHEKMLDILSGAGARIEAVLVCPHHPDDRCICRKPQAGLLLDAAKRFQLDLPASYMIGDAATDLAAGREAGCETILVKTGRGAETALAKDWGGAAPAFIADDLVDAAIWLLARRAERATARAEVKAR